MTEFTPLPALIGGCLIGLAAVLLMLTEGRIAGISGILSRITDRDTAQPGRIAFILGLIFAPVLYGLVMSLPPQSVSGSIPLMAAGGLLVGFGSVYGNGCTSGHGVCGLARLSPRSLVATLVFMGTAITTVFVIRHLAGGV